MAAAGAFFVAVSCFICEYHVYKEVWNPSWRGVRALDGPGESLANFSSNCCTSLVRSMLSGDGGGSS